MMNGPQNKENSQIVVIGAGIVGLSTAIWLSREGFRVAIIDRCDEKKAASYGNAGVIAPSSIVPVTVPGLLFKAPKLLLSADSPLFLKWPYLPRLAPWLFRYLSECRRDRVEKVSSALAPLLADSVEQHQAISKGTSAEKYLHSSDYLFAYAHRSDYLADKLSWDLRQKHSIDWVELESGEVREYDPTLAEAIDFAVKLPRHGYISNPGAYISSLKEIFLSGGGTVVKAEVKDFGISEQGIERVITDQMDLNCRHVVISGGAWSARLARKFGLRIPLESERGYHIELIEPSIVPRFPTMIASGKCVITPMEGRLRCAGIVEFGGLEAEPSKAPFKLLLKRVKKTLPSLKWDSIREWMGHRPAPSDSIPIIGSVSGVRGLYLGFGHHHVGMTAGPKTGRILSDLISGKKTNMNLQPYKPERFS